MEMLLDHMDIGQIANVLEQKINDRMESFQSLANALKAMESRGAPHSRIQKVYVMMSDIAVELKPVQSLINMQHPDLKEFFDILLQEREKQDALPPKAKRTKRVTKVSDDV